VPRIGVSEAALGGVDVRLFQLDLQPPVLEPEPPFCELGATYAPISQPLDYFCALLERKVRIWTLESPCCQPRQLPTTLTANETHPIQCKRNMSTLEIDPRIRAICQAGTSDISLWEDDQSWGGCCGDAAYPEKALSPVEHLHCHP
jgi:hypothetical protein